MMGLQDKSWYQLFTVRFKPCVQRSRVSWLRIRCWYDTLCQEAEEARKAKLANFLQRSKQQQQNELQGVRGCIGGCSARAVAFTLLYCKLCSEARLVDEVHRRRDQVENQRHGPL